MEEVILGVFVGLNEIVGVTEAEVLAVGLKEIVGVTETEVLADTEIVGVTVGVTEIVGVLLGVA